VTPGRATVAAALLVAGIASVQLVGVPVGLAGTGGSDGGNRVTVHAWNGWSGQGGGAASDGSGSGGEGGASPGVSCTYTPVPPAEAAQLGPGGGPEAGQWYEISCAGDGTTYPPITAWIAGSSGSPAPVAPTPLDEAETAESSMTLPSPSIHTDPQGTSFVNLATWLWVASSVWHPYTATASAGGVTAKATAVPALVDFSMGDGANVVCDGPGTPYEPDDTDGAQFSYCTYVYRVSSAGQPSPDGDPNDAAFTITATITWDVSWTAIGERGGGTLPPLQTSSTALLRVEQIESVVEP